MDNKEKTAGEWFALRKWTKFLGALPYGTTDWVITNYKDFLSLRSVASMTKSDREYSIKVSKNDGTRIFIEVRNKK